MKMTLVLLLSFFTLISCKEKDPADVAAPVDQQKLDEAAKEQCPEGQILG